MYNEPNDTDTHHYVAEPYVTVGAVNLTVPTTFTLESDLYPDDYGESEPVTTFAIQEKGGK